MFANSVFVECNAAALRPYPSRESGLAGMELSVVLPEWVAMRWMHFSHKSIHCLQMASGQGLREFWSPGNSLLGCSSQDL